MGNSKIGPNPEYTIRHIPLKRAFDIFFSLCVLTFGFPLFLLIAFAVKVSSNGSIIYSQERIGRGGKPFRCYKFRTMYSDAELRLKDLLESNAEIRAEWERCWKLKQDPRTTPVGKFLRKTSLDELPQFWNVLIGDLSVVGPRPVVPLEISRYYGSKARKTLSVRPGVTGPWQISGRNDITYAMRVCIDEAYVDHRSTLGDLYIVLKTVPAIFLSKGAY
jgi:undecaprenyl-phosphate galactose phosphotransferase